MLLFIKTCAIRTVVFQLFRDSSNFIYLCKEFFVLNANQVWASGKIFVANLFTFYLCQQIEWKEIVGANINNAHKLLHLLATFDGQ